MGRLAQTLGGTNSRPCGRFDPLETGSNAVDSRNKLFICYSHDDVRWLYQVKRQLEVLEAEGLVSLCDDSQLEVGSDWYEELHQKMLSARLGLLLVSATFLTSPFIRRTEIPRLFGQHEQAGMRIYPLLVRPCPWEQVEWLRKLQLRPQNAKRQVKPVSAFSGAAREQVLVNVANEIAFIDKSAA